MDYIINVINFVKMIEKYGKQIPSTIEECLKVW